MKRKRQLSRKVLSLTLAFSLMAALVPQTASAMNPVVQTSYTADPAPMAYGDTLYLYTSHDEDELENNFYTMFDWKCYSTKDMVNWTDHGTLLGLDDFTWASIDKEPRAWAPQCVERNGKFYMYVPIHKKDGGMDIGVAVSDSPTGPFKDAIGEPLVSNGSWDNIDPTVFVDGDQAYLYFGNPKLMYVKLNEDMISYDESIGKKGIVNVNMTEDAFGPKPDSNHATTYGEGPWFYKRGDLYYMVYAGFLKGEGAEHLAYSTSTSPTGPWEYRGVIMKKQGLESTGVCFTNHPGVVDFQGRSYLFYHNQALPGGQSYHRSVCVEEFTYNEDGTFPEINMTREGPEAIAELDPYNRVEAETMTWGTDVETEPCSAGGMALCPAKDGSNVKLENVGFGEKGPIKFHATLASEGDATIELHLDEEKGPLIAEIPVTSTGGADKTITADVSGAAGTHDLYIVFKGAAEKVKFDYWQFEKEPEPTASPSPSPTVPAPSQAPAATPTVPAASAAPTVAPSSTPDPDMEEEEEFKISKVKGLTVKKQKGKKAQVKWKKVKKAVGYEVRYATDKKMKKGLKKVKTKKTSCTVKKLKKKTYYFRVRAYGKNSKGKKVYGSYSSVKKVKM